MSIVFVLLGILVVIALWAVWSYNSFVVMRTRIKEAWADIDVQLKRRYDLIPNLVNTVKGYATHEQDTLEKVINARNTAMGAQSAADHAEAENMLAGALKSVFALSEAYPDLKANDNFKELQRELSDTENKIQSARRFYNGVVRDYNARVATVPSNIIASLFSFTLEEFFNLDGNAEEREVVKVDFSK